jgi:hypothetical protein
MPQTNSGDKSDATSASITAIARNFSSIWKEESAQRVQPVQHGP